MKRRLAAGAAAAVLLGLLLLARRAPDPSPLPAAAPAAGPVAAAAAAAQRDAVTSTAAGRPPQAAALARADSLRGTDVDGGVRVDAQGRVVRDRELRRLFDYFLARLGERSPARIREDLLQWLLQQPQLDAAARADVIALYDRYVELQRASAALGNSGDSSTDLQRLRALRERELGRELAQAWFGEEQDYAAQTLARLAVARDASLDPSVRAQRLAEIDASLDPSQRAARSDSTDFQNAVAQSRQFDAAAASAAQRAEQRRLRWGDAAAVRLAELDQQEASWQLRLQAYAQAREQVFADRGLSPAQRDTRLARLLDDFSDAERRRVLALADEGLLPH